MKNRIGKLEFNLEEPFAHSAFKRACSADNTYMCLSDIANYIFKPARKHGYSNHRINEIIEKCGYYKDGVNEYGYGHELVRLLEDEFYRILQEYSVNMDDLE